MFGLLAQTERYLQASPNLPGSQLSALSQLPTDTPGVQYHACVQPLPGAPRSTIASVSTRRSSWVISVSF